MMSDDQLVYLSNFDNTIQTLSALPLSGNRIRASIDLTDNHSKPNLILLLTDAAEKEVSRSIILGAIGKHIEFTLHVRVAAPLLPLTLTCMTYMEESHPFDMKKVKTTLIP
jgi:hypothetical protein